VPRGVGLRGGAWQIALMGAWQKPVSTALTSIIRRKHDGVTLEAAEYNCTGKDFDFYS
jgi:hypothetical protein